MTFPSTTLATTNQVNGSSLGDLAMKSFRSLICTTVLTLMISSSALAGDIGTPQAVKAPGDISTSQAVKVPGDISTPKKAGDISTPKAVIDILLLLLSAVR
jgi:hypothetical protein